MTLELLLNLATALGVGLLIGTERSWSERHRDAQELAGMRTFGLSGLFGGLAVLGADHFGAVHFRGPAAGAAQPGLWSLGVLQSLPDLVDGGAERASSGRRWRPACWWPRP